MKKVFLTGGSGTVGAAFISKFYGQFKFYSFSRNEKMQVALKRNFQDVEIILGAVEDKIMLEKSPKEWFAHWFDSPYYHILYKNRDYAEAELFIHKLIEFLDFKKEDKLLDLACGKGRHSVYLNRQGFDVEGVDLSPKSIHNAVQYANERLKFAIHDMRNVYREASFNYVLNLFTSFGYFKSEEENIQTICSAAKNLKKGGKLLIDFMSSKKVIADLVPYEEKTLEGIKFIIRKHLEDSHIIKEISFEVEGKVYSFEERVKAIKKKSIGK